MSQFDVLDKVKGASKKISEGKRTEREKTTTSPPPIRVKQITKAPGKSNDNRFYQIGPYIKKTTYIEVKKRLVDDHKKRDLSDLVEELLSQWISK